LSRNGYISGTVTSWAMIALTRWKPSLFLLPYESDAAWTQVLTQQQQENKAFATWVKHNTADHKISGYRAAFLSLKAPDSPPGDMTDVQLDAVADLADKYSFGEIRSTHRQNLILADVKQADLSHYGNSWNYWNWLLLILAQWPIWFAAGTWFLLARQCRLYWCCQKIMKPLMIWTTFTDIGDLNQHVWLHEWLRTPKCRPYCYTGRW